MTAQFALDTDHETLLEKLINGEYPDERGRYGPFGGSYVPETLVGALDRLRDGVKRFLHDERFQKEFHGHLRGWVSAVGRPTQPRRCP